MVDVGLGTLSIPSVLCYQCYHVLSCVIMVHVSLGTLSIHSVLCYQCYHVLSCVIVCYHGACQPWYTFHP